MDGSPSISSGFCAAIAEIPALPSSDSIVGRSAGTSDSADGMESTEPTAATREPSRSFELPQVLERSRFEENCRHFFTQFSPAGPLEQALVRDLARQVTALERWGAAAEASERTAVRGLPQWFAGLTEHDDAVRDALLAGAMSSDAADRCDRHSLARSRGLCRVLDKLEDLQTRRRAKETVGVSTMPPAFADGAACEAYRASACATNCRCGKCGAERLLSAFPQILGVPGLPGAHRLASGQCDGRVSSTVIRLVQCDPRTLVATDGLHGGVG